MTYTVTYRYLAPSQAGPFKGRMEMDVPAKKGDEIYAVFGRALVTSCRRKKILPR